MLTTEPNLFVLTAFFAEKSIFSSVLYVFFSYYRVGQAPLGGYRFRDLCDAWMMEGSSSDDNEQSCKQSLDGVYFALCGLGDSKFTTFFQNPTRINEAMLKVGAQRAGPIGKADASGMGNDSQQLVIERWMQGIWKHLAEVVAKEPLAEDKLREMQEQTVAICRKINPDFLPEPKKSSLLSPMLLLLAVLVALGAVAAYFYMNDVQS